VLPVDGSAHFKRREFRCPHCGVSRATDELLEHLELLRRIARRPIPILSGYRCPIHNTAVGGAPRSQHLLGKAADIPASIASLTQAKAAGFTGIGISNGRAVHVDVRSGPRVVWHY
jgi:uncharacterized protein YcbK (DUF882 family)